MFNASWWKYILTSVKWHSYEIRTHKKNTNKLNFQFLPLDQSVKVHQQSQIMLEVADLIHDLGWQFLGIDSCQSITEAAKASCCKYMILSRTNLLLTFYINWAIVCCINNAYHWAEPLCINNGCTLRIIITDKTHFTWSLFKIHFFKLLPVNASKFR